ncbi:MAG: helix-turn-helix domain-containing protein [Acidimicrobiia bacterium]
MPASFLRKTRPRSPASLVLESYRVSQAELAHALGVSASSLSRTLRGLQPLPEGLDVALRVALGPDGAEQVLAAIKTETDR